MGVRLNSWGRGLIAAAMVLSVASCGRPAVSAPSGMGKPQALQASTRLVGSVEAAQWHGPWLPTMDTLSVPVIDFASPLKAHEEMTFIKAHEDAYQQAATALGDHDRLGLTLVRDLVRTDALAEASLMRLALSGALLRPGRGGATALAGLAALVDAPLAEGVDRRALVAETIAEIDEPGRVTQGLKLTCESASVQVLVMRRDPAEYVRLVAGLASPEGRVKLASGDSLVRVKDWSSKTDGWRSVPSRLIQPAFATYGNLPLAYSNTQDRNEKGESGLTNEQLAKLLSGVFGQPFRFLSPENSTSAERMAAYRAAYAKGWESAVWLDWSTGHICLAENEKNGRVIIDNPYGAMHSLKAKAFESVLHSVYVPQ